MQRGLVHALAWSLATGAAVALSWWGVHAVLAGTVYDPPRAVPISAPTTQTLASSTHRPAPSPSASPSPTSRATAPKPAASTPRTPSPSRTPANTPRPASGATASAGKARSYATDGGRIVFEIGAHSAQLVSATPEPGWSMRVWTNTTWIRVDFARDDGTTVSVFCTWNDHPPLVDIVKS
ncbi:hypothetical protein E6P78_02790 [Streptomyces sp. A0958]|uniref:hypothetical protein n=1 Tax=Streptomyces sp. A0958 TaxID=2563101 RepID=UPI00109EA9BB|nr:hypothetical protein [Streptomyces sp. A0958]THA72221.1 hypothetical protein E6P78_02790 [Streptomyces sp. A0958]